MRLRAGDHLARSFSLLLALVITAAVASSAASAAPESAAAVKPSQPLVALLSPHQAFAQASARSRKLKLIDNRRPLTGQHTTLPVLARKTDSGGSRWIKVRLPGRPNGQTGWIRKRGTVPLSTSWHLVVDLSSRRVLVYRSGRLTRTFRAIVGHSSTPTPQGRFFVEEAIRMHSYAAGAPYALALSARSNVLQTFAGGPGQIALHGLANVGGRLGTAVSHGCVRLDNDVITWLAARVGPGVPVTVRA